MKSRQFSKMLDSDTSLTMENRQIQSITQNAPSRTSLTIGMEKKKPGTLSTFCHIQAQLASDLQIGKAELVTVRGLIIFMSSIAF